MVRFLGYTSYARDLRSTGLRETGEQARKRVCARVRTVLTDVTRRHLLPLVGPEGTVDVEDAARLLRGDGAGIAFHHLVLSPDPRIPLGERPAYLTYTKAALEALRRRKNLSSLPWMAVHHTDTDHPHVHVLLLGHTQTRYSRRPLVLVPDDARAMERVIHDYCAPPMVRLVPQRVIERIRVPVVPERVVPERVWEMVR